ncbi:hypothetical protein BDZ89DRAFT_1074703 [Hymenopellis radicata]|nr:hypothetical protein BDZ89DRAFT_1074703 [Hymenopellis radicata]
MKFTAVLFFFFGLAIASPLIHERKVAETESECTGDSVDVPESGQNTGGCNEDF